eukprot:COSAG01_NODE_20842_length_932_cov_1.482593_1_plen_310_part_11
MSGYVYRQTPQHFFAKRHLTVSGGGGKSGADPHRTAATEAMQSDKLHLEECLRMAAKEDQTLRYKSKQWAGPDKPTRPKPPPQNMTRLALADLARGDPGSAAVTLTLSPAAVKVLNAAIQNSYADLCQAPLDNSVPLAHLDDFSVQLIQRAGVPQSRAIEERPRSASSKGHDGRRNKAPALGLQRGAPSQYQNTVLRVTEASLPTLEKVIAVAQSDFDGNAHALDIIDWIRAELMAGRGPAFQHEGAPMAEEDVKGLTVHSFSGPMSERRHYKGNQKQPLALPARVQSAGRRRLPSQVGAPVQVRRRRYE